MKKTSRMKPPPSAESIARLAENGKDISAYFSGNGKMMPALNSMALDFDEEMIEELNKAAKKLKVSRQALIKRFIRRGLEEHSSSQKTRKAG